MIRKSINLKLQAASTEKQSELAPAPFFFVALAPGVTTAYA
jgi:hypothetical protein